MFSIIIPLYNKAHTIERTINTIISQTCQDFEIIVVNDGSTDNGVDVIKKCFSQDKIKIVEQQNKGVSVARNVGVKHSLYEFIAFIDGDDEWEPEYLSNMKQAIDLYQDASMFCSAGIATAKHLVYNRISKKHKDLIVEIDFFQNPHIFLHTSAVLVKKTMFNKAGGFKAGMKRNEDYALFFSIALLTPVIYIGKPLSIYVGDVEGQATSTPIEMLLPDVTERFNIVHENYQKIAKTNKSYTIFTKYELRHMFITHLRNDDFTSNQFLLKNLSYSIIKMFNLFERTIYSKPNFKKIAIFYLLITKIRWRMRGFPVVGENL